ncbi:TadE family protein [Amphiplicatus metriothermophilus]|nr:TadE/TadG family type IV pilus assembly protein [Amphiplicatus metriothermophilus]MBB5518895.1 Flp pilus assembly protein TadG [Amphiplicatus metriothermophilus]
MAATEFALILPILVLIFFGMLEASDAMLANRRATNAGNALADLVSQAKVVTPSELQEIFTGVTRMLQPPDGSSVSMTVVSVSLDPDDNSRMLVEWSRNNAGETPYAAGSEYDRIDDVTVLQSGVSLVVSELIYDYNSGLTSRVLGSPLTISRIASRWPRRSVRVKLCPDANPYC